MFRVAVLDDYQKVALSIADWKILEPEAEVQAFTDNLVEVPRLAERLHTFDAAVLMRERTPFPRALFERLPNLRMLVTAGMRNASIDMAAAAEKGVLVTGTEMLGHPTAELTWGLILAAARQIPQQMRSLQNGTWQTGVGSTVRGKTLGVFGYGRIGAVVAGYGRAFGMKVLAWARPDSLERAKKDGHAAATRKEAFFEQCDVLSLHMRLVDATRGIVSAEDLARMKPTAILVNTSRAPLIAPGALVAALKAGRPGWAAVDVYEKEPVRDPKDPLLILPNVVCTPHIGYVSREEYELQFSDIFDQINSYAAGKPINVVNPDALKKGR